MVKTFNNGDKVFAKVRGYPPWPARVEGLADATPSRSKYNVYFYGTSETAVCKVEDLYAYSENKDKYGRPLKRKGFNEALAQIEGNAPLPPTPKSLETRAPTDDVDSDTEGDLVIDESPRQPKPTTLKIDTPATDEKKKVTKRKRESDVPVASESESDNKRTKRTSLPLTRKPSLPAPDSASTSPGKNEQLVSRSGRKIKPKKFADEENAGVGDENASALPDGKVPATETPQVKRRKSIKAASAATRDTESRRSMAGISDDDDDSDREDSELYMDLYPSDNPKDLELLRSSKILTAVTPRGEVLKVTLDEDRPETFPSERARKRWERDFTHNAAQLKAQIESGAFMPQDLQDQLEMRQYRKMESEKLSNWDRVLDTKKGKLRPYTSSHCEAAGICSSKTDTRQVWLRMESRMVEVDAFVKGHLGLMKAEPDRCLILLDELSTMQLEPLMLKKHPQVVETIKRLRRYVGNPKGWNYNEEQRLDFNAKAQQIRNKAEHVYNKFKAMFTVPEGRSFWQVFADNVTTFHKLTANLTRDKVFALVVDPVKKSTSPGKMMMNSVDDSSDAELRDLVPDTGAQG